MTDPSLSAAFGNYDRICPLQTGGVQVDGFDLRIQTLSATEIFRRMCRDLEFGGAADHDRRAIVQTHHRTEIQYQVELDHVSFANRQRPGGDKHARRAEIAHLAFETWHSLSRDIGLRFRCSAGNTTALTVLRVVPALSPDDGRVHCFPS